MAEIHRDDPYKTVFDRCGGGSTALSDQQWVQFLDLLVDTEFLGDDLAQRFRQEHEGQPHSLEAFQRDLCKWVDDPSCSQVDGILDEMKKKTQFLHQVIDARHNTNSIDVNFLHSVLAQAESAREKLAELEETTSSTLASKWLESNLFGSTNEPTDFDPVCPWKFQQANARYLRVEDRHRARYQLRLHQCDENTDRVLKEAFYPILQQFREVQVGVATLASRKRDESDEDEEPELAIVVMIRRQSASEEALLWLDNLVAAYRQLSLSPYVQQYLGSEDVSGMKQDAIVTENLTTRQNFEYIRARSLSELVSEEGLLLETSPLFKLYARERRAVNRLLADNVLVSRSGRRLFLGKLDFGDCIDPFESDAEKREITAPRSSSDTSPCYIRSHSRRIYQNFVLDISGVKTASLCPRIALTPRASDQMRIQSASRAATPSQLCLQESPCDGMWNFRISKPGVLVCIDRRYSPMEFHFQAKLTGNCTITFSPLGSATAGITTVAVTICRNNFCLHQSKAQMLISALSGDSPALPHELSPRMLLHQHEYFQPL